MPLWIPQAILALSIIITMATGVWLMLNARAVARLFRSTGFIVPGPGPRLAGRPAVIAALVMFNLGWIASVGIWSWAING